MPRAIKHSGKSTDIFAKNHDSLIVYAKGTNCRLNTFLHDDAGFKFRDEFFSERGLYKLNQTLDYDSLQYSNSLDYPLTIDGVTYYTGSSYKNFLKRKAGNINALGQNDGAVNVIEKFEFVKPGNYINAADFTTDALDTDIANNRFSNVAITEDGGILLEVTNNGTGAVEKLLVTDAMTDAGYSKDFVVNGIVAQVGQNVVNVDKFVNFYLANGLNATARVDSSVDGELSIWLSDSLEDRGKQFEGDFTVIDATKSNAVKSELAGNDNDNIILAGNTGATSLWGGNGGNDLLVDGEGVDSFFYGLGNGSDTISNVSAGDD